MILWKEDTATIARWVVGIKLKSLLEENIVWNQALTRNKELAGDKIATIENIIMNINNYLDSTSWQWLTCSKWLHLFWRCRQAIERKDMAVLVWLSRRRYGKHGVFGFAIKRWFTNTIVSTNWPRLLVLFSYRRSLTQLLLTQHGLPVRASAAMFPLKSVSLFKCLVHLTQQWHLL